MDNKEKIFLEIDRETERNNKGLKKIDEEKEKEAKRIRAIKEYEEHKWNLFKRIIKGEKFFRFDHLNRLGIKYNIAIHLSSKNTGKTTEIYREMERVLERGEKFLYGRVYPTELDSARAQFNRDIDCPVVMLSRDKRFFMYRKSDIETWRMAKTDVDEFDENARWGLPRIIDLEKLGIEPVGMGYTFYKSNCLEGGKYDGYSTIFFDEILSYNPRNMINDRVLAAWGASVSTITRTKPNIVIYMLGNLQPAPSHPILAFYGISVDDDLRVIRRGEDGDECTILFINSGGLYKGGFKNQAGITKHTGIEHRTFLESNKLIKPTPNILTEYIFDLMDYDTALAFSVFPEVFYVELRKIYSAEEARVVYCVRCNILRLTTLPKGPIFSDDPNVFNRFHNVERRRSVEQPFNHLNRLYRGRTLKFDSMESMSNFSMIYNKNRDLIYTNAKR